MKYLFYSFYRSQYLQKVINLPKIFSFVEITFWAQEGGTSTNKNMLTFISLLMFYWTRNIAYPVSQSPNTNPTVYFFPNLSLLQTRWTMRSQQIRYFFFFSLSFLFFIPYPGKVSYLPPYFAVLQMETVCFMIRLHEAFLCITWIFISNHS